MRPFIYSPLTGTRLAGPAPRTEAHYRQPAFADREWLFNPWDGHQRSTSALEMDPQGLRLCAMQGEVAIKTQHLGDDFDEPHMLKPGPVEVAPLGALDAILEERGKRYGMFIGHATITQRLKDIIDSNLKHRDKVLTDDQQEALDMICHKIGRIVNGDPDYADSWDDIAGYAKLVGDRLKGVSR